jgi:hypothetical protein
LRSHSNFNVYQATPETHGAWLPTLHVLSLRRERAAALPNGLGLSWKF